MSGLRPVDVDAYSDAAPAAARPMLRQLRRVMKTVVPSTEERLSYGMPSYHHHGRLAYFAAHQQHVGLYALGPADALPDELKQYAAAKGTLQFSFWASAANYGHPPPGQAASQGARDQSASHHRAS
jgi:uncharacterized protein YdhG (YjbR/CyaY superfamily)